MAGEAALPPGFQLENTPPPSAVQPPTQAAQQPSDPNALPQGFQLEEDKYDTPVERLKGDVGNALSGLTLGGSDVALTKSGIMTPEEIKGYRDAHPVGSAISNAIGTAGLFAAAPVGAGTEALIGGTAGRLVGMGAEGALMGAGNAVSDYALGDPNLNAQKIASDVGMGALFGVGFGALSKVAEAAIPPATQFVKNSVNKLADIAGTGIDKIGGDWGKALQTGMQSENPEKYVRSMSENLGEVYKASKDASKELYETSMPKAVKESLQDVPLEQTQQHTFDLYSNLESMAARMKADPDTYAPAQVKMANKVVSDLQNDLVSAQSPYEIHKALHDFGKDISAGIKYDKLPTFSQQAVQGTMRDMNTTVRDFLKNPEVWGEDAANHFSQVSDAYNQLATARKNFESSFMSKEFTPSGMKKVTISPNKVNGFFNNIESVGKDLQNQHLNDFMSATKNISDMSENLHGYRDAGQSISDKITQLAKTHEELQGVAKVMSKAKQPSGVFKELLGANVLTHAGVSNPVVASALGALEAYKAIKNPYALGSKLNTAINTFRAVGKMTESAGNTMNKLTKAIFSSSPTRAAITDLGIHSYDKKVDRIQQLVNNPQTLMNHLNKTTGAMYDAAPNISNGLHQTMLAGLQFLQSKIPQPPNHYPLDEKFEPSDAQKDQFDQYYATVNDPTSVLTSIKEGSLSNYQLEAMQSVYPHLLTEMRSQVLQSLQKAKSSEMEYTTKIALSKFLGMPLDASMTMPAIMSNQMAFMPPQAQQQGPAPKPPRSTVGGLKELDVANRKSTQTQDLEKAPA